MSGDAFIVHKIRISRRRDNSRVSIVQMEQELTTVGPALMTIVNVGFVAFTARIV